MVALLLRPDFRTARECWSEIVPETGERAAVLRAEARFALLCGVILIGLGLALSILFVFVKAPFLTFGLFVAPPPLFIGWLLCAYAAARLEEARRIDTGALAATTFGDKMRLVMRNLQRQGRAD